MLAPCPNCAAEPTEGSRFCSRCGKRLQDDFVDADIESRLFDRMVQHLREGWTAQAIVEKEMALKAASYLAEWLKLAGIPLGITAAIGIGVLSFWGIKTANDLANITAKEAAIKETTDKIATEYKSLQDDLPALKQTAADVVALRTQLITVQSQVARVDPTPELSNVLAKELGETLNRYAEHLASFGLKARAVPSVRVVSKMPDDCYHGCFDRDQIYILAGRPAAALAVHEYSHAVLMAQNVPGNSDQQWQYSAIEAGVANYLTADFLKSPAIDDYSIADQFSLGSVKHTWQSGQGEGGRAWGSILWHLRQLASNADATRAIVQSWIRITPKLPPPDYQRQFVDGLVAGGVDASLIRRLIAQ